MKVLPDDKLMFHTTGRVVSAHNHIIGIDERGSVYDGYDGQLDTSWETPDMDGELSAAERKELSEYMIIRWQRFGASR